MDKATELLNAIDEAGWKVTKTSHPDPGPKRPCPGCLYAAMNGISLAKYDQDTNIGYTGPGNHEATVMRKKAC